MQRTMPDGRPTTIATGADNEDVAETYLRGRGYRIIERNFKTKIGELDIVAREAGVLCFVEVRSRTSVHYGDAIESVDHFKRARVSRMAQLYLTWRRPDFAYVRFDVLGITGDRITLIRDAWRL
ncbi:MAG: YraN family protein [Deltaproteobacteria bacterium]